MTRNVAIYVFEDVEVLDFAGPYEVFSTASRLHQRSRPLAESPFGVQLVSAESGPIKARYGLRILPDCRFSDCPRVDILIVPGGLVEKELERAELSAWVLSVNRSAEIVASVCTGSFILAKAGILDRLSATTHWEDIDEFSQKFPEVEVRENVRWVDENRILTSAGISAGIDMSLHIVSRLEGRELAERTARQMDYRWQQTQQPV